MKPALTRLLITLLTLSSALLLQPATLAQQALPVIAVSAATLQRDALATGALGTLYGQKLATTTAFATDADPTTPGVQLPRALGGTTVRVDGELAELLFVSPQQINFRVPNLFLPGTGGLTGFNTVEVTAGDGTTSLGDLSLVVTAPGFFTANGSGNGIPAGVLMRVRGNGTQSSEPLFTVENGVVVPRLLDFGAPTDRLFLTLFMTGLRNIPDPNGDDNTTENVRVLMNDYAVTPAFVGAAPGLPGVEQINVEIPRTFQGLAKLRLGIEVLNVSEVAEGQQNVEIALGLPTIGALTWRAQALAGKRVLSLLSNASATLAGTDEGVYRTPLGSSDWKLAAYGLPGIRRTTGLLPQSFLSGLPSWLSTTDGSGVWFSPSDGATWTQAGSAENSLLNNTKTLALNLNADYIFVGTDNLGVARARRNLEGSRWEAANPQFTERVQALATNGPRLLAGTAAKGLYVSSDNGTTWTQNSGGLPINAEVRALLRLNNAFFAGTAEGLFRSTDNGVTWMRLTEGVPSGAAINTLYAYGAVVLAGTVSQGVLVSNDNGVRWQTLSDGLSGQTILALGQNGNQLLAGTATGLFAAALTNSANQPPIAQALTLTLEEDTQQSVTLRGSDPDNDTVSYTITRPPQFGTLSGTGANLIYLPDENFFGADEFQYRVNDAQVGSLAATVKITVTPVNDPPQINISGTRLMLTGQFADLTVTLSDIDNNLFSSNQSSQRLTITAEGLPPGAQLTSSLDALNNALERLAWVPTTAGNYTITFTGKDDGTPALSVTQSVTIRVAENPEKGTWTAVNSPIRLPNDDIITELFADGTELYAASAGLSIALAQPLPFSFWRSTDNGATWQEVKQGLTSLPQAFVRAGNDLIVGTAEGVFRSPAPGANTTPNWTPINTGLPAQTNVIALAFRENRLVLGTRFGLYLSTNRGDNWTSISGALPLGLVPPNELSTLSRTQLSSVVFSGTALFVSINYDYGLLRFSPPPADPGADDPTGPTAAASEEDLATGPPIEGVFRSTDNGATWQAVNAGLGSNYVGLASNYSITDLLVNGTTLYAWNGYSLFRSTNQGTQWQRVPTPPFNNYPIFVGLYPPTSPPNQGGLNPTLQFTMFPPPVFVNGKFYLPTSSNGVYTSREDGGDWLPINLGLLQPQIQQLLPVGTRLYALSIQTVGSSVVPASTRLYVRDLPSN